MTNPDPATTTHRPEPVEPPARTHQQASVLLRRPFGPGAIGFRAMTKVPFNGDAYGGAAIAAFLNAQSVTQRLNSACPGAWRMDFAPAPPELVPANNKKLYLACRLTITLPVEEGGQPVDAVYSDIGEMDAGSLAGLKALYSDARKRAAVAAGIGAYLYTALAPVVVKIGNQPRQVHAIRRPGKPDLLVLTPETEQWLRHGYQARMHTEAVRRDLGEMLGHGEPEIGMGQGEAADITTTADPDPLPAATPAAAPAATGDGGEVVAVDFAALGPNGDSGPHAA
jgi:hypothetical protein